jgi:anti-sigma regulatory factor (Ser/Thr protein kinase)
MTHKDDGSDPDVRYEFDHSPRAAAHARDEIDQLLNEPDDPIADDVRLATSELVTNVVEHTSDGGELRAWDPRPDVPLRLEVEDGGPGRPEIPAHKPKVGGLGLSIVDTVSDRWGVDDAAPGKVVWAEFDRHLRAVAAPPADEPVDRSEE